MRRDAVRGCALRLQGLDCPWLASSRDNPVNGHTDQASDDGGYDVKPLDCSPRLMPEDSCFNEPHQVGPKPLPVLPSLHRLPP